MYESKNYCLSLYLKYGNKYEFELNWSRAFMYLYIACAAPNSLDILGTGLKGKPLILQRLTHVPRRDDGSEKGWGKGRRGRGEGNDSYPIKVIF